LQQIFRRAAGVLLDSDSYDQSMARTRTALPRDPGLQARMLFTMFLLGALYVAFAGILLAAGAGIAIMVVALAGFSLAQLFFSDKLALASMGAKVVSPAEAPGLHSMIERLCIQADLPKPRIAIADSDVPNAFAMGRSQKSATVCATTGILNTLQPHELEGVMAHELTHVKNRDVMIMTLASFFASVAAMITQFGFFFGGGMGGDGDGDGDGAPFALVLLASFVVYIVSFFLMLALSRYREFAADRGSALITGRPSALASALMRLSTAMERVPDKDLRAAENMNAFFIVPTSVKSSVKTLFMTHPPLEKRIEALQRIEAQLQAPVPA
jgi:heat shock protein HtpX